MATTLSRSLAMEVRGKTFSTHNFASTVSFGMYLKVTGYGLQLRMRGARLRFTVNSELCARLWRQFFIAELTSNRISDWISILRRKGQGGSKSFTEINILFVRYCAFYLPDLAKSEWLCGMNDHHSFFQQQRSEVAPSRPLVS